METGVLSIQDQSATNELCGWHVFKQSLRYHLRKLKYKNNSARITKEVQSAVVDNTIGRTVVWQYRLNCFQNFNAAKITQCQVLPWLGSRRSHIVLWVFFSPLS